MRQNEWRWVSMLERESEKRERGEGVKQQSLELRANYCNCNLDSKHRDAAVTGSRRDAARTHDRQKKWLCAYNSTCAREGLQASWVCCVSSILLWETMWDSGCQSTIVHLSI